MPPPPTRSSPKPTSPTLPRIVPRGPDLFTTTTIFAPGAPTAASSGASRSPPLPVGPIVGGLLGGVCLALAAVGGWIWWGKAIEKRARKERRLRPALKHTGPGSHRGSSSANASRHSLPRTHPARNTMASASQKSVTFAPVPSVRTAGTGSDREDRERGESEPSTTPTPTLRASPSGSPAASVRDTPAARTSREDVTPTQPTQAPPSPAPAPEASTPVPPAPAPAPTSSPTATPRTPPRSTLRPPPSQRSPSAERAYVPARPSPLAHASHPPPSSMRPLNVHAHNHTHTHTHTHTAADPEPGAGTGVGAGTGTEAADTLSPPHALLPRPSTLSVSASADRTSAVTVSAPSEYSQEGTASESGEPPPGPVRMVRGADGRLYAAARYEGAGVGVGDWGERRGGEEERGGTMPLRIVPRGQYQHQHQQQYHSSYATPRMR